MADKERIVEKLNQTFSDAILKVDSFRDELTVVINKDQILEVMRFLKEDPELSFDFLSLLCAVDYYPDRPEMEIVYHLYSMVHNHRIRIKAAFDRNNPKIPSVTSLWSAANWHEREAFDLMGVHFEGHPDLRRILLPDDWEGHPLRKDYPLEGAETQGRQGR